MSQKKNGHNAVEKIIFSLGLAILIGLVSYLTYQLTQKKNEPPTLIVTTSHEPSMEHYAYKVKIENIGEETAASVNLKFNLYQNGISVESGTVVLDYVPTHSMETAWIVFHKKKKPNDSLVVSSVTYVKP